MKIFLNPFKFITSKLFEVLALLFFVGGILALLASGGLAIAITAANDGGLTAAGIVALSGVYSAFAGIIIAVAISFYHEFID